MADREGEEQEAHWATLIQAFPDGASALVVVIPPSPFARLCFPETMSPKPGTLDGASALMVLPPTLFQTSGEHRTSLWMGGITASENLCLPLLS